MTTKTPREALIGAITNYCAHTGKPTECDVGCGDCAKIVNDCLTAMREGGHLRTPGTVEFCVKCQVDRNGRDLDQNEVVANAWANCPDPTCPLKVTNEKD